MIIVRVPLMSLPGAAIGALGDRVAARTRKAGGSMMGRARSRTARAPIAANTARYCKRSATGTLTPNTVLAKPIRRSAATPPIAESSDQVRLCRVVRGAPRNAKATITKASG